MSVLSDDNFSMSADKYLAKHNILTYLEDSITQLLEHREENPKVVPTKFLCEYFCSLRDGNHTMFREFSYIKSTPHNRASFVALFWKCFRQIGKKGDLLSIQEYHSLLGLLCPHFPFQLVQKTARIVLIDDALDCLISFSDFIYAFQVQFYYEEFLEKSVEIYRGLLQTMQSPRDPVIVPTSGENDSKSLHQSPQIAADGVDAMQFFRSLYPLLDRVNYSTPPLNSLKEILFNATRISFYEFLMAIAKSDTINSHIGRLPGKADLLEGADAELSSKQQKTPRTTRQKIARKTIQSPRPLKVSGNSRPSSSSNRAGSGSLSGGDHPSTTTPSANQKPAAVPNNKTHHTSHLHASKKFTAAKPAVVTADSDSDSDSDTSTY